ncbi:MAG: hypothetical protein ACYS22_18980 [Planctomycetota bacterium]
MAKRKKKPAPKATKNQKELAELKEKVKELTAHNAELQSQLDAASGDAGEGGCTREELEAHVQAMEKACRKQAEAAIAATAEQARVKIEALRDEARALRSRVATLESKKKSKKNQPRMYTEEEVLQHVNAMERSCREEAEKALKATSDRARDEIRKWKTEARRLQDAS